MMLTVAWLFPPYSEQKGHSKKGCSLVLCQVTHMPLWKAWLLLMDLFINSANVDWVPSVCQEPHYIREIIGNWTWYQTAGLTACLGGKCWRHKGPESFSEPRPGDSVSAHSGGASWWAGPDPSVPSLPWVSALSSVKWRWPVSPLPTSLTWQHGTPVLSFSFIF